MQKKTLTFCSFNLTRLWKTWRHNCFILRYVINNCFVYNCFILRYVSIIVLYTIASFYGTYQQLFCAQLLESCTQLLHSMVHINNCFVHNCFILWYVINNCLVHNCLSLVHNCFILRHTSINVLWTIASVCVDNSLNVCIAPVTWCDMTSCLSSFDLNSYVGQVSSEVSVTADEVSEGY